jgi:hypothetical protein
MPRSGARLMLQAAKRAGAAAIGDAAASEDSCRTATPTLRNLMVRLSRTGGGCLTAMQSLVGSAGSGTASARRLLGVAGCGGGSGVF